MISNLQKTSPKMAVKPKASSISVSPLLTELAYLENSAVFTKLKTSPDGLSRAVVEARMVEYGANAVAMEKQKAAAFAPHFEAISETKTELDGIADALNIMSNGGPALDPLHVSAPVAPSSNAAHSTNPPLAEGAHSSTQPSSHP